MRWAFRHSRETKPPINRCIINSVAEVGSFDGGGVLMTEAALSRAVFISNSLAGSRVSGQFLQRPITVSTAAEDSNSIWGCHRVMRRIGWQCNCKIVPSNVPPNVLSKWLQISNLTRISVWTSYFGGIYNTGVLGGTFWLYIRRYIWWHKLAIELPPQKYHWMYRPKF